MQKLIQTMLFLMAFFLYFPCFANGNEMIFSFQKAKNHLLKIHLKHPYTFYCKALFFEDKTVILPQGFYALKYRSRAYRIEWEHIVPAENFGRAFSEWREGHPDCINSKGVPYQGRKCVLKVNKLFQRMHADMHNLVPSIGAVNAMRSNYRFIEFEKNMKNSFGSCPMKISDRMVEPPEWTRGQIARTYLYFTTVYPIYKLSKREEKLFQIWNKKYPPNVFECQRNQEIAQIQGNLNMITLKACQNLHILDHFINAL